MISGIFVSMFSYVMKEVIFIARWISTIEFTLERAVDRMNRGLIPDTVARSSYTISLSIHTIMHESQPQVTPMTIPINGVWPNFREGNVLTWVGSRSRSWEVEVEPSWPIVVGVRLSFHEFHETIRCSSDLRTPKDSSCVLLGIRAPDFLKGWHELCWFDHPFPSASIILYAIAIDYQSLSIQYIFARLVSIESFVRRNVYRCDVMWAFHPRMRYLISKLVEYLRSDHSVRWWYRSSTLHGSKYSNSTPSVVRSDEDDRK